MKLTTQSMTGFARSSGQMGRYQWVWELRSVNGKGLDLRLRLPSGFEHFETPVKDLASRQLTRGNVQIGLSVSLTESKLSLVVNESALDAVIDLQKRLGEAVDQSPMSVDRLLNIRGIAEFREADDSEETIAERDQQIMQAFTDALGQLFEVRSSEGQKISAVLSGQIERIEQLTQQIECDPSRNASAILGKLETQIGQLMNAAHTLDHDRLHAEAVLLATKADVREEIDRLYAHIEAARALLDQGGPCGRRLDFLAQEFNREANTICSKSNAVAVTSAGLELKTVIDQFREQLQNLE